MVRELKTILLQRFGDIEDNKLLAVATIIDPRFKNKVFRANEKAKQAETFSSTKKTKIY